MQIGREGHAGGEYTLALLALALAVELLPPLGDVEQFRLVRAQNLDLLAAVVDLVAHDGITGGGVLGYGAVGSAHTLHVARTLHQSADVDTRHGQRQQSYGGKHRVTAAHVVGNDERRVALVVGQRLQRAARRVGYGHDALGGLLFAVAALQLGLQKAECDRRLGRGARLRDHDDSYRALGRSGKQLVGIVLRYVLAGEENRRVVMVAFERLERVGHGFQHGLGSQIRAADAYTDYRIGLAAQLGGHGLDIRELFLADRRGERNPAQKIVAGALARMQQLVGACRTFEHRVCYGDARMIGVESYKFHSMIVYSLCVSNQLRRQPRHALASRGCGIEYVVHHVGYRHGHSLDCTHAAYAVGGVVPLGDHRHLVQSALDRASAADEIAQTAVAAQRRVAGHQQVAKIGRRRRIALRRG